MWQRIQTVFLLIAAIAAIAFIFLPVGENEIFFKVMDDTITAAISVATGLLSLFTITQFRNRKLQIRMCMLIVLFALVMIISAYFQVNNLSYQPLYHFLAGVPIVIIISALLARRNIKKDDALVRSMDRFR